jgi:hypothetical protein
MNISKLLKKKNFDEKTAFFLSILLVIAGTLILAKGVRDMDTALNICIVKLNTGVEFADAQVFHHLEFTYEDLENLGIFEVFLSFLAFIWAIGLMWYCSLKRW